MTLDNKQNILEHIAQLVAGIEKDSKIGTAYEKYDTRHLWKLGKEIQLYSDMSENKDDIVSGILIYLNSKNIRCTPVLLKNAETARRSWQNEADYLRNIKGASYGKLKAILPVVDPDFISQMRIPSHEIKNLLTTLNRATYEEILERVRRIRQIYDQANLSVDIDEFYSDLHSINHYLESAVTKKDYNLINYIRSRYSQKIITDVRIVLAAMRNEDSLQKLLKTSCLEIKNIADDGEDFALWFSNIVKVLTILRHGTPELRERIRRRIGV